MKLLINCSPKLKYSSTQIFLNKIKNKDDEVVYLYKDDFDYININDYNTIVFASPLYADSPSSKLIEYMEYIENNNIDLLNKYIYFISNSGFLEYEQNYTSDKIIEYFCKKNKALFMGYLNIGSGPALGEDNKSLLYKLLGINYYYKIHKLKKYIDNKCKIKLDTKMIVPRGIYIKCANRMWDKYK